MTKHKIEVDEDFLEHLLNCLANQKYIGQWNAEAMANPERARSTDRKNQEAIDKAWSEGMQMLREAKSDRLPRVIYFADEGSYENFLADPDHWEDLQLDDEIETLFTVEGQLYTGKVKTESNWTHYEFDIVGTNEDDIGFPPELVGRIPDDGTHIRLRMEKMA